LSLRQQQQTRRFELWAVGCFAIAVGVYCWVNLAQPSFGRLPQFFSFVMMYLMGFSFICGVAFVIMAFQLRRRQLLWCLPVFIALWLAGSAWGSREGWEDRYEAHFSRSEPDYYRALDIALQSLRRQESRAFTLTDDLAKLTRNGKVLYNKSEEGVETVTFPIFLWGIDNERGFAWTSDGKPPVQGSVPEQLVTSSEIRPGWFVFGST
jgi:hypothetical protein